MPYCVAEYRAGADLRELEALLGIGLSVGGMTTINLNSIFAYIERDHARARSAIALSAIATLDFRPATELFRMHLGVLMIAYFSRVSRSDGFQRLVGAAVPDLDDVIAQVSRVFMAQQSDN